MLTRRVSPLIVALHFWEQDKVPLMDELCNSHEAGRAKRETLCTDLSQE